MSEQDEQCGPLIATVKAQWQDEINLLGPLVKDVQWNETPTGLEALVRLGHAPVSVRIADRQGELRLEIDLGSLPRRAGALATLLAQNADGVWYFGVGEDLPDEQVAIVLESKIVARHTLSEGLFEAWQKYWHSQGMLLVLRGEFDD